MRSVSARGTAALTAVLVVGGLLLMHGLEPPGTAASHAVADYGHVHVQDDDHGHGHGGNAAATHATQDGEDCTSCGLLGHGVLLCVAVVGSVLGLRLLQRVVAVLRHRTRAAAVQAGNRWDESVHRVHRPPRPVWVELAVMRC